MQKKRPNVLFLASWFPNKNHKTVGNFIQRHAEVANTIANVYVLFATPIVNQTERFVVIKTKENGVNITRVYYKKVKNRLPIVHHLIKLNRYKKAMLIGEQSIGQKFDFMHVNTFWFAGLAALKLKKKLKIRYIITEHWSGFLPQNNAYKSASFLMKIMTKKIFRKAEFVLPVSHDLGKSLQAKNLIQTYTCLANVVDTDLFKPKSIPTTDIPRFIHISTIDESHKNFTGLLQAFSQVKQDFRLEIITDGDIHYAKKKIKTFALEDKVELQGSKEPKEVAAALQNADCLVQFSNVETFSIVLAEAWSTGKPCIYAKCGGLTNILDKKLGIQIPSGNVKALTNQLEAFMLKNYHFDEQYIRSFALNNFSEEKVRKQLNAVYQKV